ncbi:putative mitochondrial protein, partial [Mucuna pruriens]
MPKTFWAEAVAWSVHVLNRSPTLVVRNKTTKEAWNIVKPSVKYFRVFGCISHVHVPDAERTKLDDKSLCCVLLGVKESTSSPNQQRCRRPPLWMEDYETGEGLSKGNTEVNLAMVAVGDGDPTHFDVAVKIEKWRKAMDVEMEAIKGNDTWELMELPDRAKKVGVKWVYKTKFKENGEVDKYKARIVVKGYAQEYGIDYI